MSQPDWIRIQQKTFTRWCNTHLTKRNMEIADISKDLESGLILINLLEQLTQKVVAKRYTKKPMMRVQKVENVSFSLKFVQNEGIKLVAIGAEDIVDGNLKLILGFIWSLILRYQIAKPKPQPKTADAAPAPVETMSSANDELLKWVRSKIPQHDIKNFTTDWQSGLAIYDLVNAVEPGTLPQKPKSANAVVTCTRAMDAADEKMNIPQILDPQDMIDYPDKHSNMTYISYFRDYVPQPDEPEPPAPVPSSSSMSLEARQLGEYVRGDYTLDTSIHKQSKTDYISLTMAGSPEGPEEYIIQEEVDGPEGTVIMDCTDYIPIINRRQIVLRYCKGAGIVVVESAPFVFEYEVQRSGGGGGMVARLNGLTLQATFERDGEIIHQTSVHEHPEYYINDDEDNYDDDNQNYGDDYDDEYNDDEFSDPNDAYLFADFRRRRNLINVEFDLHDTRGSQDDYFGVAFDGSDDSDFLFMECANGKRRGKIKIPCDGSESEMNGCEMVVRYFKGSTGRMLGESNPFTYKRPRN